MFVNSKLDVPTSKELGIYPWCSVELEEAVQIVIIYPFRQ